MCPHTGRGTLISVAALVFALLTNAAAAQDCSQFKIDGKASQSFGSGPPTSGGCHAQTKDGFLMPDPHCTPGAINPTLTADVLRNSEFRTGCVRDTATSPSKKATKARCSRT